MIMDAGPLASPFGMAHGGLTQGEQGCWGPSGSGLAVPGVPVPRAMGFGLSQRKQDACLQVSSRLTRATVTRLPI